MTDINFKLSKNKIKYDKKSHLQPDLDKCKECKSKICTKICPAKVYEWTKETDTLIINYENCLECGACRIACEKNNIKWQYPKNGITFKQS